MRLLLAENFDERPDDDYILASHCDRCQRKIAIYENKDGLEPQGVICMDCFQEAKERDLVQG